MRAEAATAALVLALLVAACGSARRSEPLVGALPITSASVERGRVAFAQHCYRCHPGGEGGLGPALNDKPVPGFAIESQVRLGLGKMPSFSEEELPPERLDDIVAYLMALRAHPED